MPGSFAGAAETCAVSPRANTEARADEMTRRWFMEFTPWLKGCWPLPAARLQSAHRPPTYTACRPMTDFARAVEALRPQLLRFARAQLRNDAWSEDAVGDTVLAALAKPQAFAGQSQLKTWLVGILKHKLIDQIRRH